MRWYQTPVEDELPAEEYIERAERFHRVAVDLPPLSVPDSKQWLRTPWRSQTGSHCSGPI